VARVLPPVWSPCVSRGSKQIQSPGVVAIQVAVAATELAPLRADEASILSDPLLGKFRNIASGCKRQEAQKTP